MMTKKIQILLLMVVITLVTTQASAQKKSIHIGYGNTLNVGIGLGGYAGYYGYIGKSLPVIHFNYELAIAKDFTLAPFISAYAYSNQYYWGSNNYPYKYYTYRQTVVPIGAKGTYYLDQLLKANNKWDFYVAGSLGFAIVSSHWDADYYGNKTYYASPKPLFLDLHAGAEYHINHKIGLFLDLSTGVSTIGLGFH